MSMHCLSCFNHSCYWARIPWVEGEESTFELMVKAWKPRELTTHFNSLLLSEWQLIMSSQTCDLRELIREGGM